jgi:solute carrier family 13 (sodium-dependent dicarboxylate transporter), member 2/3/5
MPDRLDAADGPAMAAGGSPLRSMVAASVALALVAVIQFALPYPAEARYVLVVFALAIVGWVLLPIDDTVVALAAVAALFAGGVIPLAAVAATLTNPLIGFLIGAFAIAAALTRSGLAERAVIAVIGGVRSVTRLFHGLALVILATAFVIPATTCRAALFLPVFLTLAASLRDARACASVSKRDPALRLRRARRSRRAPCCR